MMEILKRIVPYVLLVLILEFMSRIFLNNLSYLQRLPIVLVIAFILYGIAKYILKLNSKKSVK